jgi:hypothetical protein
MPFAPRRLLPMIDSDRLFKLRLVVARHGEMDGARWWNTEGLLGSNGALAVTRGFPRTHYFAQARLAFAVAAARCREVFAPPDRASTLWQLPAEVEDGFQRNWREWQKEGDEWNDFLEALVEHRTGDLVDVLASFGLVSDSHRGSLSSLVPGPGKSVEAPTASTLNDDLLILLAAGFARGAQGELVVPFARLSA